MHEVAAQRLAEIVSSEGQEVISEPRRLQALLLDRCGEFQLERYLLSAALDAGVPETLVRSSDGQSSSTSTVERLARQLESSRGLEYDKARWAVDSWASALNLPLVAEPDAVAGAGRGLAAPTSAPAAVVPPAPPSSRTTRNALIASGAAVVVAVVLAVALTRGGRGSTPPATSSVTVGSPSTVAGKQPAIPQAIGDYQLQGTPDTLPDKTGFNAFYLKRPSQVLSLVVGSWSSTKEAADALAKLVRDDQSFYGPTGSAFTTSSGATTYFCITGTAPGPNNHGPQTACRWQVDTHLFRISLNPDLTTVQHPPPDRQTVIALAAQAQAATGL